jgi:hypothetical protein
MLCQICNKKFESFKQLGWHLKTHKITAKEYYIQYLMEDILEQKCNLASCDNLTSFKRLSTGFNQFCSQKCCNKVLAKRIRSKEEIEIAKQKHLLWFKTPDGKAFKERLSKNRLKSKNPRHKRSAADWKKSYKKQSNTIKEKIAKGEFTPCVTNSWANSKCKLEIRGFNKKYRSTWEAVFQILNPQCEYEILRVQYISPVDNDWHNYIVDFIDILNKNVYEIKPKSLNNTPINEAKRKALIEWCKINNYTYNEINDVWFRNNASLIDYSKYDEKIQHGMKQFL